MLFVHKAKERWVSERKKKRIHSCLLVWCVKVGVHEGVIEVNVAVARKGSRDIGVKQV